MVEEVDKRLPQRIARGNGGNDGGCSNGGNCGNNGGTVSMVVLETMEVLVPLVRIKMGFGFLEV